MSRDDPTRTCSLDFLRDAAHHVETHPRGRVCAKRGCRTRLSVYNAADRCELHRERDESLTYYGKTFRVCSRCGLVAEIRKNKPSRKCSECGTRWGAVA